MSPNLKKTKKRKEKEHEKFLLLVLAVLFVLGITLTGCAPVAEESSDTASTEASDTADDATDVSADTEESGEGYESSDDVAADLSDLQTMIDEVSEIPEFTLDLEPIDAKAVMTGKKVMTIPQNSSNPFATGAVQVINGVLEEMGAEVYTWENQGTPDEWAAGIQAAINQDMDFVQLFGGADPGLVAGSWTLLKEAGIPLMTTHFGAPGEIATADYRLGVDFKHIGELLAAWTILEGGTDVNTTVFAEYDTESGPLIVEGFRETFEKYAPDAIVEFVNVPINDWAAKMQNEMQNAIQRNPDIDYLVTIYDSMLQWAVPAIELSGKTGEIKMISYNGTPFILDMVREGKVEMDIGESIDWIAYAACDIIVRDLAGVDVVLDQQVPRYLFTQENADTAGVPAEYGLGYGDAYIAGYKAAWGLE